MTYSMTAFAKHQQHFDWGDLQWEIRSVNHRFLDCHLRLPDPLKHLDSKIRQTIKNSLHRGKIDLSLIFTHNHEQNSLSINTDTVQNLAALYEDIQAIYPACQPMDQNNLLRWPGVMTQSDISFDERESEILASLENTLTKLKSTRHEEGEALKTIILKKHRQISTLLDTIDSYRPSIIENRSAQLKNFFLEAQVECDPSRLEQELVMFAQKADITEEIDRTRTHLHTFGQAFSQDTPVGRRIDFLTQELVREVNTICSKTQDAKLTHHAVEIKTLLEQIREQIQNVE